MRTLTRLLAALVVLACPGELALASEPLRALIVDGQNNHDWRATTPVMNAALSEGDLFHVDVATSPENGDLSQFEPAFADYDVVVLNYNGALWSETAQQALVAYVHGGGGLAVIHAANNSFPEWPEYNEMIGLGGWGGRSEKSGPYIRFRDGEFVRDETPGAGGSHGAQHPFQVVIRDPDHPIVAGLPAAWMHATDELYDRLRGPALNLHVLATAYAAPDQGGTGEHEPMIMTIDYGDGRVFHTPMGHSADAMRCVGFQVVLRRGCEWAATGEVRHTEIPQDFPTADEVRQRQ